MGLDLNFQSPNKRTLVVGCCTGQFGSNFQMQCFFESNSSHVAFCVSPVRGRHGHVEHWRRRWQASTCWKTILPPSLECPDFSRDMQRLILEDGQIDGDELWVLRRCRWSSCSSCHLMLTQRRNCWQPVGKMTFKCCKLWQRAMLAFALGSSWWQGCTMQRRLHATQHRSQFGSTGSSLFLD